MSGMVGAIWQSLDKMQKEDPEKYKVRELSLFLIYKKWQWRSARTEKKRNRINVAALCEFVCSVCFWSVAASQHTDPWNAKLIKSRFSKMTKATDHLSLRTCSCFNCPRLLSVVTAKSVTADYLARQPINCWWPICDNLANIQRRIVQPQKSSNNSETCNISVLVLCASGGWWCGWLAGPRCPFQTAAPPAPRCCRWSLAELHFLAAQQLGIN